VRRMAMPGRPKRLPFDHGPKQMQLLAGWRVTTKSVERIAEAIEAIIAQREQQRSRRPCSLDLPVLVGPPLPILYVQMDWDRSSRCEERDGGSARQERGPTRSYPEIGSS